MKATDLSRQIARREIVPPVVTTPTVLSAFWRGRMADLYPAESVVIERTQLGQFAALIRLLGEDRALSATAYALSNWRTFRYAVNMELEGTAVASKTPSIGTVLRHRDLLISMMDAG
ncbi:hypothetical protein [Caballeronia sp. LjRoot31]|uniref:hypothetical protein n=1 Tax=Caballeronia sp. LjRoot31 TaxID=3342324 RepID=UPI003ED0E344